MRPLVGLLGLVWALANLLAAYLLVRNSFTAGTPAKEGLPAQILLLLGGLALAVFALMLLWGCVRLASAQPEEA
jgi:hypothetical protein